MILSCPNCSTRFLVDASALGSAGRTVRCGACGHEWRQEPEKPAVHTFAVPASDAGDSGAELPEGAGDLQDREEPAPARRLPRARRRSRQPRGLFSFLLLAVIAVVLLGSYQFRGVIVARWPETARFYESLGIVATPYRSIRQAVPRE
ncbi:MAG: zinc-ribbon domain-containing protein [Rhodospirillaceae bacterium]|nr:zinc-ribbon domain-containing protein [Rhodospirillaceae bacterium]